VDHRPLQKELGARDASGHRDYIEAGAEIVTANTFAASRLMLGAAGIADKSEEIVTRAIAAARDARDASLPRSILCVS
jgi:methionine synthase I (cobalamin-dependent)